MNNKYFNIDDLVVANITMYEYVNTERYQLPIKTLFFRQIYLKINEKENKGFIDIFKDKYIKKISKFYSNPSNTTIDYNLLNIELTNIEKITRKISYKRLKEVYFELNKLDKKELNSNLIYLDNYRKR